MQTRTVLQMGRISQLSAHLHTPTMRNINGTTQLVIIHRTTKNLKPKLKMQGPQVEEVWFVMHTMQHSWTY